jgi:hypothetical protein
MDKQYESSMIKPDNFSQQWWPIVGGNAVLHTKRCFSIKPERTSFLTSELVVVENVEQLVVDVFGLGMIGGVPEVAVNGWLGYATMARQWLQIKDASKVAGAFQCMFELLGSSVSLIIVNFLDGQPWLGKNLQ